MATISRVRKNNLTRNQGPIKSAGSKKSYGGKSSLPTNTVLKAGIVSKPSGTKTATKKPNTASFNKSATKLPGSIRKATATKLPYTGGKATATKLKKDY